MWPSRIALVGAALAMIGLMLPTLGRTTLADISAEGTELLSETRSARHKSSCRPARLRAILVQTNALRHLRDILLAKAGGAALHRLHLQEGRAGHGAERLGPRPPPSAQSLAHRQVVLRQIPQRRLERARCRRPSPAAEPIGPQRDLLLRARELPAAPVAELARIREAHHHHRHHVQRDERRANRRPALVELSAHHRRRGG